MGQSCSGGMVLFAVFFGIALDGLGLIILARSSACVWPGLQGVLQAVVVALGLTVYLTDVRLACVLIWIACLLGMFVGRYFLHRYLASAKQKIDDIRMRSVDMSPELWAYFFASMVLSYLGLGSACGMPAWGSVCWAATFAFSAVLLFTLGGVGMLIAGLARPIIVALRLLAAAGVAALLWGCWRSLV